MDRNDKLKQLFMSEAFKKEADGVTTAKELQDLFSKHDVEMTYDEVIDLCGQISKYMDTEMKEELSEDDLDNVSGGASWIVIGFAVVCIGTVAFGIYMGYQEAKRSKK